MFEQLANDHSNAVGEQLGHQLVDACGRILQEQRLTLIRIPEPDFLPSLAGSIRIHRRGVFDPSASGPVVSYSESPQEAGMAALVDLRLVEHVTPHDLVTYSRCPYEMELLQSRHASLVTGRALSARTPLDVIPLRHSPLLSPPTLGVVVNDGRLDVAPDDRLVYEDTGEADLPILFAESKVQIDPRFRGPNLTLIDPALGLSGRPDYVVQSRGGEFTPVEYKSTHLFVGYHESHGRTFDVIQAIAECRLVHAVFGSRPSHGIILYGDVAGDGEHEGWVQVPYGPAEERWLQSAIDQIRHDGTRAPVPTEGNCRSCLPNRDGLCRFAAARFGDGGHAPVAWGHARR